MKIVHHLMFASAVIFGMSLLAPVRAAVVATDAEGDVESTTFEFPVLQDAELDMIPIPLHLLEQCAQNTDSEEVFMVSDEVTDADTCADDKARVEQAIKDNELTIDRFKEKVDYVEKVGRDANDVISVEGFKIAGLREQIAASNKTEVAKRALNLYLDQALEGVVDGGRLVRNAIGTAVRAQAELRDARTKLNEARMHVANGNIDMAFTVVESLERNFDAAEELHRLTVTEGNKGTTKASGAINLIREVENALK